MPPDLPGSKPSGVSVADSERGVADFELHPVIFERHTRLQSEHVAIENATAFGTSFDGVGEECDSFTTAITTSLALRSCPRPERFREHPIFRRRVDERLHAGPSIFVP